MVVGSITVFCGVASRGVVGPKAAMELGQIIGPHDPDKLDPRMAGLEGAQGVDRKAGPYAGLHIRHDHRQALAGCLGHIPGLGHALGQVCRLAGGL